MERKPMNDIMRTSWHLAALSKEVGTKPISRTVVGTPVALFRTAKGIAALVDRCPHRNYPLSKGHVEGDGIVCPYHGWSFGTDGTCDSVPGCEIDAGQGARLSAKAVKVQETHGAVFVLLEGDAEMPAIPAPFSEAGFDHFWWDQGDWRTTTFDAIENVMDPFHTTELHHGHIRNRKKRQRVSITVENFERAVEMTIHQRSPDNGFMARIFERNRTSSRSRFDAPTRFQGTWEGTDGIHFSVLVFFTPSATGMMRPVALFATPKGFFPGWFKAMVIKGFISPVVRQDRDALEAQSAVIATFGAPRYAQGPGDPLGNRVRRLMDGATLEPGMTDRFEATL
jgi:phenylpropionate dioxygenase-like ring-hydroxylating dioxygenase large terminal subunit